MVHKSVVAKNLPLDLVFGQYNGQELAVVEEFHSRTYGTSLRVRAKDGREFSLGSNQYTACEDVEAEFYMRRRSEVKQFIGPGLRRIQTYSARCTT